MIRSDYLVRLNTSPAGGIADLLTQGDAHSVLVLTRDKEFFANEPGNSDTLRVNGTTLVGEDACPIGRSKVAIFVYDNPADGSIPGTPDGVSNIDEPNWIHGISFLTGIDFVIPAADPPDETVCVELTPRGGGATQVVNYPNLASSQHGVSIRFNDFPYNFNTMWYLAEGATAGDFETWVLVQNPGADPVAVDLSFMTGSGLVPGPQDVEIAGNSRMSFNADLYVTDFDVSTKVEATGAVICERAVYGGNRTWAHDSIGYSEN